MIQRLIVHEICVSDCEHLCVFLGSCAIGKLHAVQERNHAHYTTWFGKSIQIKLPVWNVEEDLNPTSSQDVHLIRRLALLEDFLIFFKDLQVQNNCQLVKDDFREVVHELDVSELLLLPYLEAILISEEVLLKLRTYFWEHENHLVKFLVVEVANHSIVLWSHTGTSWMLGKKGYLSKEVSSLESSDKHIFLSLWVLNEYFTFSLFDKEEPLVLLTLVDQWELRVKKHEHE